MFPIAPAADLLALSKHDLNQSLDFQHKRALDFIMSARCYLAEDQFPELSEKIFWQTYVRLEPAHIKRILYCFPYVNRMLGKYGLKDDNIDLFADALCVLVLGVKFEDNHDLKSLLEINSKRLFDVFDRNDERYQMGRPRDSSWPYPTPRTRTSKEDDQA